MWHVIYNAHTHNMQWNVALRSTFYRDGQKRHLWILFSFRYILFLVESDQFTEWNMLNQWRGLDFIHDRLKQTIDSDDLHTTLKDVHKWTLSLWLSLLGTRFFEKSSPLNRTVELGSEIRRKVGISKIWRVILLHKVRDSRQPSRLPVIPEPFRREARHRKYPPVYKDAEFGVIVPIRKRALV